LDLNALPSKIPTLAEIKQPPAIKTILGLPTTKGGFLSFVFTAEFSFFDFHSTGNPDLLKL